MKIKYDKDGKFIHFIRSAGVHGKRPMLGYSSTAKYLIAISLSWFVRIGEIYACEAALFKNRRSSCRYEAFLSGDIFFSLRRDISPRKQYNGQHGLSKCHRHILLYSALAPFIVWKPQSAMRFTGVFARMMQVWRCREVQLKKWHETSRRNHARSVFYRLTAK